MPSSPSLEILIIAYLFVRWDNSLQRLQVMRLGITSTNNLQWLFPPSENAFTSHVSLVEVKSFSFSHIHSILPVQVLYIAALLQRTLLPPIQCSNQHFTFQDDISSSVQLSDRSTAVEVFHTVLHCRPTAIDILPIRSHIFSICHDVGWEVCNE